MLLHWALIPQALGSRQRLTQEPSTQLLVASQSLSLVHSTFRHSSLGSPWSPCGQMQTGRWLATLHSAEEAQPEVAQASWHLPDTHCSFPLQSLSLVQPGRQVPPVQRWPCGQGRVLVHACRHPPDTQDSPHEQLEELEHGFTQTPSEHFWPLWQSEGLLQE